MGCPCGEDCCENSEPFTPEHECSENFCEECYVIECRNCGDSCNCEL